MSKDDASTASLILPVEYDFTDGQYECALMEVFLPNTQRIQLPPSPVYMLWYLPSDFEDASWRALKTGKKETIESSNMIFLEEGMERIPSMPPRDDTDVCSAISRHIDNEMKYEGTKTSLSYFRGYIDMNVSERTDSNGRKAFGIPIFSVELKEVLGFEKDWFIDQTKVNEKAKNFLKNAKSGSKFSSTKVANIHMLSFFNEVYFNAVGSIVPRIEHKVLRFLSNAPATPRSVHFNFDPPIWLPVQAKKFKDFTVNIKDSSEKKAVFEGGQSLFNICFRRKNG